MSLIQRTDQIQRILNKFRIPSFFMQSLSPIVIPIIDLDALMRTVQSKQVISEITGTGWALFVTVPTGKRWIIKTLFANVDSGTMTLTAFGISYIGNANIMTFYNVAAGTNLSPNQTFNLAINQGDVIAIYVGTLALKGNLRLNYIVEEEEMY